MSIFLEQKTKNHIKPYAFIWSMMDFKNILTENAQVEDENPMVKVNIEQINELFNKQNDVVLTQKSICPLDYETHDEIANFFVQLKQYLSEYGFLNNATVTGFINIVQQNMVVTSNQDDYSGNDVDEFDQSSDLLPYEEKTLFE